MKEAATAQNLNCFGNLNSAQLSFSLNDGITLLFKAINKDFRMNHRWAGKNTTESTLTVGVRCAANITHCKRRKKVDLRPCSAVTELFLVPAFATETHHGCDPVTDTSHCGGQLESVTFDLQMCWALTALHHLIDHHPSSYWNILKIECLTVMIRYFVKKALGTADGRIH